MKILIRYKISIWVCLISLLLILPPTTAAHPLDEFYQVTYILMAPNRITLQVELYPGVLVAPRILGLIDTNQDDHISPAESQAYVDLFLKDVTFEVDDRPTSLTATNLVFPTPLDLRAGVGVIRFNLYADLPADHRGSHHFFYKNNHQPDIGIYLVSALGDAARWVDLTQQEPDIFQASIRVDYIIETEAPLDFGETDALALGGIVTFYRYLRSWLIGSAAKAALGWGDSSRRTGEGCGTG